MGQGRMRRWGTSGVCGLLLATGVSVSPAAAPAWAAAPRAEPVRPAAVHPAASPALPAGPLEFVESHGRFPSDVDFYVPNANGGIGLARDHVALALYGGERVVSAIPGTWARPRHVPSKGWGLSLDFVGADPAATPTGQAPTDTAFTYYRGTTNDHCSGYGQVRYAGLWPGVDAQFDGGTGQLESTYTVAPGGDPSVIRLAWRGATSVQPNADGSLEVDTGVGPLRESVPVAYQTVGGRRRPVPASWSLTERHDGSTEVGFAVGAYDRSLPLVIDPVVVTLASYLGGGGDDLALFTAADGAGGAWVTGNTTSPDFPTTPGAFQPHFAGGDPNIGVGDVFVAHLDRRGHPRAVTYLGGSGDEFGAGIAVDRQGNVWIAGGTSSTDFPLRHPFQDHFAGADPNAFGLGDAFVAKLDPRGQLTFSSYLGGSGTDQASAGVAVDRYGNAWVGGFTTSADFPLVHPFQAHNAGDGIVGNAFISRITPDGRLAFSSYLGGSGDDAAEAIAVDRQGNAWLVGQLVDPDFPTLHAFQPTAGGAFDGFVARVSRDDQLTMSSYYGGSSGDGVTSVAVDGAGNAWIAGATRSPDIPLAHPFQPTNHGVRNGFVAEVTPQGALPFSSYVGGSGEDFLLGLAIDPADLGEDGLPRSVWLTGQTTSTDFPTTPDAFQPHNAGGIDALVLRLSVRPGAVTPAFASYLGGSGDDEGIGIAARQGAVWIVGATTSTDFPTVHPFQPANAGGPDDAFVARLRRSDDD